MGRLLEVHDQECVTVVLESSMLVAIVCERVVVASTVLVLQCQVEMMESQVFVTRCR